VCVYIEMCEIMSSQLVPSYVICDSYSSKWLSEACIEMWCVCVYIGTCEIMSSQLVPGDVIIIPASGCVMSCDAVVLLGSAIVDESMLTGQTSNTPRLYTDTALYINE